MLVSSYTWLAQIALSSLPINLVIFITSLDWLLILAVSPKQPLQSAFVSLDYLVQSLNYLVRPRRVFWLLCSSPSPFCFSFYYLTLISIFFSTSSFSSLSPPRLFWSFSSYQEVIYLVSHVFFLERETLIVFLLSLAYHFRSVYINARWETVFIVFLLSIAVFIPYI